MTHDAALKLAETLLVEHNLSNKGWQAKIRYNYGGLACCDYNKKQIGLTPKLVAWTDDAKIKDAILHEIAHALVGYGHGHDDVWTRKATEIGCTGDATMTIHTEELTAVKYTGSKIQVSCPVCGLTPVEEMKSFELNGKKYTTYKPCLHIGAKQILKTANIADHRSLKGHAPYPYQVKSVEFLEEALGRGLIAHEMGLGKSMIERLYRKFHPETLTNLLVCKAGLTQQWWRETLNWTGDVAQIIGQKETIFPGFKYYIISFDLLKNIDPERLKKLRIKSVTIDECQHIKNPSARRTQEVRKLIKMFDVQSIIALSGTPFKNRGSEYFTILNILNPERFPSLQAFMNTYVDYYYNGYSYKEGGIRNLPKFKERTADFVLRYERKEVMPELPSVERKMHYVPLGDNWQKAYDAAVKNFVEIFKDSQLEGRGLTAKESSSILAELQKLRRITGNSKVPDCVDFVADFLESTERKITIFLHHHSVAKALTEQLNALCDGMQIKRPLILSAEMNAEARQWAQDQFNQNPEQRILIASTLSSGEGLNLQQSCSDCIILERQWNPGNEEQAESRFVRIGQTAQSVSAVYMLAGATIDEWITDIVEQKRVNFIKTFGKDISALKWDQSELTAALYKKIMEEGRRKWSVKKLAV